MNRSQRPEAGGEKGEEIDKRLETLPRGLREHLLRVREVALELAQRFGADADKVETAALLHDLCRATKAQTLLKLARDFGLTTDEIEEGSPLLLHGAVAAELARRELGINDQEVLDAVAYHTTGRKGMGLVEQVVFLADKLDPQKLDYPGAQRVLELSRTSLEQAILEYMDLQVVHLVQKGLPIHPLGVEARNELLRMAR